MSLHYLLDGYNIIHQMPGELPGKLEDQRLKLIRYLEIHQPQGSSRNQITIVFDGKFGVFGSAESGTIKVVFSKDETADELIKSMVDAAANHKNIVVVSDDRSVQYAVRALGAQVKAVSEFMG